MLSSVAASLFHSSSYFPPSLLMKTDYQNLLRALCLSLLRELFVSEKSKLEFLLLFLWMTWNHPSELIDDLFVQKKTEIW